MKDKFLQGAIAGLIAGIVKDIPTIIAEFFLKTYPTYWSYSSMVVFGELPKTFLDYIYAFLVELLFSVFVGVTIVYIIGKIPSKHYLVKGMFFGGLIWF
jgi:uncharacterized membrane protein